MFRRVCPAVVFLCVLASVIAADGSGSSTASLKLRGIVVAQADIQVLTPRSGGAHPAIATISAATNSRTGCSLSVSRGSRTDGPDGLIVNGEPAAFVDGSIHLATIRRTADGTGDSVSVALADAGSRGETLWLDIIVP
ncbi:MAG: hypothetical protein PF508_19995 [Spirochaeta sp.]|jgi:hypothetical protein|nr:hypothetical protein [Spirochaeta sp.]